MSSNAPISVDGEPKDLPAIDLALQILQKEVIRLEDEIAGLENRLARVMTPANSVESTPEEETTPEITHSAMFTSIRELARRVGLANIRLSEIKRLLEL